MIFTFIVTELMKYENQHDKVEVLAKNSEEYISIAYGNIYRKLMFLDSYRFLQKGLADVAKSLNPEDFKITSKYFDNSRQTGPPALACRGVWVCVGFECDLSFYICFLVLAVQFSGSIQK